jgi:predicted permease
MQSTGIDSACMARGFSECFQWHAQILGASMIPCTMLVLGAVLCKGPGHTVLSAPTVIVVCAARLILIPLLGERWAPPLLHTIAKAHLRAQQLAAVACLETPSPLVQAPVKYL